MNFNRINHTEIFGNEREEAILQQFRSILSDLVRMLRHSTGAKTIALHWVNRQREIFVPEAYSSARTDVVFKDRIPFDETYLHKFKDQTESVWLKIGDALQSDQITHYYDRSYTPSGYVYIQPFQTNNETIALTVIECDHSEWDSSSSESISAFSASLDNLLHTYLELSNLLEAQKGWLDYEKAIDDLLRQREPSLILWEMARLAQRIIPGSEVSLCVKEFNDWKLIGTLGQAFVLPGTRVNQPSLVHEAITSDTSKFSIHINGSPHRVTTSEISPRGASIAIPIKTPHNTLAILLVNHSDALSFNDANRHQLLNMVRLVGLKLELMHKNIKSDLIHAQNGSLKSEFADHVIEHELVMLRSSNDSKPSYHVWLGYASLVDYNGIRTKLSTDQLKKVHQDILHLMSAPDPGTECLTIFHTDHIYGFMVYADQEDEIQKWGTSLNKRLHSQLHWDIPETASLHLSAVHLQPTYADAFSVHERARKALNTLIRKTDPNLKVLDDAGE